MGADPPNAIVFALGGPVAHTDVPALCERLSVLIDCARPAVVVCDVGGGVEPNAVAIEALARLQLTARRRGCRVRVRDAPAELQDLLAFAGLNDLFFPFG